MPDISTTPTTFLRLLSAEDKAAAMRAAVAANNNPITGSPPTADVYTVDPASFRQIPGSPFAYWVSEGIRYLFTNLPPFEHDGVEARLGMKTNADPRFLRAWWEVSSGTLVTAANPSQVVKQTFDTSIWVGHPKGGMYSPFYADAHLVINWQNDGAEIKEWVVNNAGDPTTTHWSRNVKNVDYYFRPGLTYPRRTQGGFSVRVMPAGCIFADKGPAIFVASDGKQTLLALLATVNSAPFRALLSLQMAFGSYEVGVVQRTPVPDLSASDEQVLAALAREAHDLKRAADRHDEVKHPFMAPALVRLRLAGSLVRALSDLAAEDIAREQRLAEIQREIDNRCFALYGFSAEDRAQVEGNARRYVPANGGDASGDDDAVNGVETDETDEDGATRPQSAALATRTAADLLMYAIGCAFGRWDVRIGYDPSLAPQLADPFAPLPVCAPGTLVGPDGLPATAAEDIVSEEWLRIRPNTITLPEADTVATPTIAAGGYSIPVAWDGILVDDPDAQDDIVRRVRATLDYLWGERAESIEREACTMLSVQDLRDYLRNPRGFFDHHISHYSKSRRKAPIYWLLQSPKRHYGIWLYYHQLDADLVFKALNFHLLPKIRLAEQRLTELETAHKAAGTPGAEARRAAQMVERQEALLADLREFYAALDRAAKLYLKPDLNDGVLLNIAPFWEVVPWKEAKSAWQQLLAGKYEWSSIGKQLREKGLVRAK